MSALFAVMVPDWMEEGMGIRAGDGAKDEAAGASGRQCDIGRMELAIWPRGLDR